jgi:hypothetical protein
MWIATKSTSNYKQALRARFCSFILRQVTKCLMDIQLSNKHRQALHASSVVIQDQTMPHIYINKQVH